MSAKTHEGPDRKVLEGELMDRDRADDHEIPPYDEIADDGTICAGSDDTLGVEIIEDVARAGDAPAGDPRADDPRADDARAPAPGALLSAANGADFRARWDVVQRGFVDDPANAVREGDALVCELMNELARVFADARTAREGGRSQRSAGGTEELRLTLRRRRALFEQLLAL